MPDAMPVAAPWADLRALRVVRGLTLARLAAALGRSVGWLSQVERGLSRPSVDDLRALARALGVPLAALLRPEGPEEERGVIVRAGARRPIGPRAGGLSEELLTPDLGGALEVVLSTFAPGSRLPAPVTRPTEEVGLVVEGRLDLTVAGRTHALGPGDSFRLRGEPFAWANPGEEPARVVWVVTPPVY